MNRFTNKAALITGAGSGIGEATAVRLASEGAKVIPVGRTANELERVAQKLPANQSYFRLADLSDRGRVEELLADVVSQFAGWFW
jgi:meso-butanediol dehydrogenase/(S,S)-butanediol dehydrogenase/diacetyl reductase